MITNPDFEQECIPVGCVPSATVAVCWGSLHPPSPGAGTPWADPPQLPPWLWAWTGSPSTSPLAVGLDWIPLNFPLGCGPGPDPPQLPPWVWTWRPPPRTDPPKLPLGCGPGNLQGMLGYHLQYMLG